MSHQTARQSMRRLFTGVGVRTGGRIHKSLFTVVAGTEIFPTSHEKLRLRRAAHLTPDSSLRVLHLLPAQPLHTHVVGVRSLTVCLGRRRQGRRQRRRRRRRSLGDKYMRSCCYLTWIPHPRVTSGFQLLQICFPENLQHSGHS